MQDRDGVATKHAEIDVLKKKLEVKDSFVLESEKELDFFKHKLRAMDKDVSEAE